MTPDSVDDLYEQAVHEPAFSNSDEGYGWMDNWCDRCVHDKSARSKTEVGPGCPLVLVALMGRRPMQWLDGPRDQHGRYSIADQYHCIEFRSEDDGPSPEPTPIPTPPGQGELLPREPFEVVRMLTPLPNPAMAEVA